MMNNESESATIFRRAILEMISMFEVAAGEQVAHELTLREIKGIAGLVEYLLRFENTSRLNTAQIFALGAVAGVFLSKENEKRAQWQ